jgi:hypothetical protein
MTMPPVAVLRCAPHDHASRRRPSCAPVVSGSGGLLMTMPPVAVLRCAPAPHEIGHAISRGPRPRWLTLAAVLPTMLAADGSS